MPDTPPRLAPLLAQFDFARGRQSDRLAGLTDEEYFWEPAPGCWSVRRRAERRTPLSVGGGEWVLERERGDPQPAPFTTTAWRVAHLAFFVALRADDTVGTAAPGLEDYLMPASADAHLDRVGRSSMPWGLDPTLPFLDIVWWVNREAPRYGREIALLRDLYRAWPR